MINTYISYILWIDIQKMGSLHNNKFTICFIFHIYHKGKDVSLNLLGRVLRIILKLLICSSKNYISFFFYILFSNVIINFIKKKEILLLKDFSNLDKSYILLGLLFNFECASFFGGYTFRSSVSSFSSFLPTTK